MHGWEYTHWDCTMYSPGTHTLSNTCMLPAAAVVALAHNTAVCRGQLLPETTQENSTTGSIGNFPVVVLWIGVCEALKIDFLCFYAWVDAMAASFPVRGCKAALAGVYGSRDNHCLGGQVQHTVVRCIALRCQWQLPKKQLFVLGCWLRHGMSRAHACLPGSVCQWGKVHWRPALHCTVPLPKEQVFFVGCFMSTERMPLCQGTCQWGKCTTVVCQSVAVYWLVFGVC